MITAEEFQEQYHDFRTPHKGCALEQLRQVRCEETVVGVKIGEEYCLMLKRAAQAVSALGIASEVWEL